MFTTRVRRTAAVLTGGTAVALLLAAPVAAHIHTDPPAVEAGTEASIAFTVSHGCDGSPTTKVEIEAPEGSSGVQADPVEGWTTSTDGTVAVWEGGPLADDTEGDFPMTLTVPAEAGDVAFKVIQTCEVGTLEWIEEQVEGQPEPESPAPMVKLTDGPPTDEDLGHGHDDGETEHGEGDASGDHAEEEAAEPTTTLAVDTTSSESDDDSSSAPLIIAGIAAVAVVGGGGYALSRRNKA